MQLTLRRVAVPRAISVIALLALILAALIGAALIAGGRHAVPPPFGLARTGLIATDAGGDIVLVDAEGTRHAALPPTTAHEYGATWSLDGLRLAYWSENADGTAALNVVDADGTHRTPIGADLSLLVDVRFPAVAWSPDGSHRASTRVTMPSGGGRPRTPGWPPGRTPAGRRGCGWWSATGRPESTCTTSFTQVAPAFSRSVRRLGHEVIVFPCTAPASIRVQPAWQIAAGARLAGVDELPDQRHRARLGPQLVGVDHPAGQHQPGELVRRDLLDGLLHRKPGGPVPPGEALHLARRRRKQDRAAAVLLDGLPRIGQLNQQYPGQAWLSSCLAG